MTASPTVETGSGPLDADFNRDATSLENEQEDSQDTIKHPFDPEQIKIRTGPILVGQLIERIKHKEIDLAPDFQRLRDIWKESDKIRLIESLLLKIPIPVFYVSADESENWAVVDGVQRMSTIYDYVVGKFPLAGLQYLIQLNGCKYDDLSRALQRRISETHLIFNVIEPGTPPDVMFNVFLRINTGGLELNAQEIRHAIHRGPVRDFLRDLAESPEFTNAAPLSDTMKSRMQDRECVLRFLAFYVEPWEEYTSNDLHSYLGETMKNINRMNPEQRASLTGAFKKAMRAAFDIFHKDAFRKPAIDDNRRGPINRALFETWSVQLARCSEEQINALINRREDIKSGFTRLITEDRTFDGAVSYSTGTNWRVHKRFASIKELVEEFI